MGWLELLMNGAFVDYSVSVWFGWNMLIGFHSDVRLSSLILLNIAVIVFFAVFFCLSRGFDIIPCNNTAN